MRTHGTGRAFFPMFATSAYFHSFWISALPAAVVPMTDWWHPMHVFTAGMPTSAERVAVLWAEKEVGPSSALFAAGAGLTCPSSPTKPGPESATPEVTHALKSL